MKVVSMYLSRQYASTDMQPGSRVTLTWGQILTFTVQGHVYLSMRRDERNTMPFEFYLYRAWFKSYQ